MGVFTEMPTFGLFPWGKPQNGFGINGPLRLFGTPVVLATVSDLTLTMAELLAGYILRDPIADDRDDVLPTATLMVQGLGPGVTIGAYFDFAIKNTGTGVEDIDLNAGVGVTLNPTTVEIAPGETGLFRAVVTNVATPAVTVYTLGILVVPGGTTLNETELVTDDRVLTAADNNKTFFIATDGKVFTLPSTIAGLRYTFVNIGAAGNNIITIASAVADYIAGTITLAATVVVKDTTDDKDLINTKSTTQVGDYVTLMGDGVGGWFILGSAGIWASE